MVPTRPTRLLASWQLSFTEVVELVLPLLKGCISQRAAFLFGCYDVDSSGLLTQKELFDVVKKAPGDGPFEKDLVGLLRQGARPPHPTHPLTHARHETAPRHACARVPEPARVRSLLC